MAVTAWILTVRYDYAFRISHSVLCVIYQTNLRTATGFRYFIPDFRLISKKLIWAWRSQYLLMQQKALSSMAFITYIPFCMPYAVIFRIPNNLLHKILPDFQAYVEKNSRC